MTKSGRNIPNWHTWISACMVGPVYLIWILTSKKIYETYKCIFLLINLFPVWPVQVSFPGLLSAHLNDVRGWIRITIFLIHLSLQKMRHWLLYMSFIRTWRMASARNNQEYLHRYWSILISNEYLGSLKGNVPAQVINSTSFGLIFSNIVVVYMGRIYYTLNNVFGN